MEYMTSVNCSVFELLKFILPMSMTALNLKKINNNNNNNKCSLKLVVMLKLRTSTVNYTQTSVMLT